ncbi:MAG: VWA domain-containing protein, partial [Candidatus Binatia bacterium]
TNQYVGIYELAVIGRFDDAPLPATGQAIRAMAFDPLTKLLYYAIGRDVRELNLSVIDRKDRLLGTVNGEIEDLIVDTASSARLFVGIRGAANESHVDTLNAFTGETSPFAIGFTRLRGLAFDETSRDLYVLDSMDETGNPQSHLYRIQPQSSLKADFVFLLDNSGSMGDKIEAVRQGLNSFVANMAGSGIDARFAIIVFGGVPCLQLDFTRNVAAVQAAFTNFKCGGGDEAGLEAIRMVLGETAVITGGIQQLQFRSDARKNLILLTDEDSDAPTSDANVLSGQSRGAEPPNTITGTVWQQEVDLTAQALISNQAFINLLIDPNDPPSRSQYGDPGSNVSDPDFLNFSPEATLASLEVNGFGTSLQAQVLRTGLVGRSFNITNVNNPNFVQNFFAAKVEEVVVNQPTMQVELRHFLPPSGYAVDPASVIPTAEEVSSSLVRWDASVPLSGPSMANFELSGVVSNITAGESRAISLGSELVVTIKPLGSDPIVTTINLPPVTVAAAHIIDLDPTSRTVERGAQATYDVLLTNPFATDQTFSLSTIGLDGLDVTLDASVNVPAGQTVSVLLTVAVPTGTSEGTRVFSVQAQLASGGVDTVDGELIIIGGPGGSGGAGDPPSTVSLDGLAVDVALTPASATGGQGTAALFTVRVTNVGNEEDTYTLSGSFPPGFTGEFADSQVTVLPGLDNYRDVTLTVTPPPGASVGNHGFTVRATSTQDAGVQDDAAGSVNVVSQGVEVDITPSTGGPATTFQMTIKNTGQSQDTFDLQLSGPVGVSATLGASSVTLAPNASQTVPITLGSLNFPLSGGLDLIGAATSQANNAVKDQDSAQVVIGASKGLSVSITPAVVELPTPGTAAFLVQVDNIGNGEDAYTAEIMETTGPVTAALSGLNRQPTQKIETFRLPGLSTGGILLNSALTAPGEGKITVKVTSLSDPSLSGQATVTVTVNQQAVCGVCMEPPVVVDSVIELDAANLAQTAGVLAPFASFDGQTITIDVGNHPLVVTATGRINVPAGPKFHPTAFHQGNNHSSPHLVLQSSCTLELDAPSTQVAKLQTRSLTGVIETVGNGGRGGDITLAFEAGILIDGRVQSIQERLPDDPRSISGAITVESQCGPVEVGPMAWVVSWGDKGSGAVTLRQGGAGDLIIAGLVMNRVNRSGSPEGPTINVQTEGNLTIDGSHLIADEFNLDGTRYDLTSGLLTLAREPASVGQIRVQAQGDITITRDVRGLALNRLSYAAVSAVGTSGTPQGGEIVLHALQGGILLRDRAVQADGKRDNSVALIEVKAGQDVVVANPSALDIQHGPTLTTGASPVNSVGKGGINVLQSCDGSVTVEAQAQVLATGQSVPGRNELTADDGTVLVQGTVTPPPVAGTACDNPGPLF